MLALNIGENDPVANKLVSIEMGAVSKMKFKKAKQSRKDSIQRIFAKMVQVDADNEVAAAKAAKLTSPKWTRRSMNIDGPGALVLDSSEQSPPVVISMKSVTPRKASFTPGILPVSEKDTDGEMLDPDFME
jgi:hypothetical protein